MSPARALLMSDLDCRRCGGSGLLRRVYLNTRRDRNGLRPVLCAPLPTERIDVCPCVWRAIFRACRRTALAFDASAAFKPREFRADFALAARSLRGDLAREYARYRDGRSKSRVDYKHSYTMMERLGRLCWERGLFPIHQYLEVRG